MTLPSEEFVRHAKLKRVIDGDTLRLQIDQGFGGFLIHDVRLVGVNTPEVRGKESAAGGYVKSRVIEWMDDCTDILIHSKIFELGKFGRCLCDVWVNGRNLNRFLIDHGFGWRTDENGRLIEERAVWNLEGIPDGIKQQVREAFA